MPVLSTRDLQRFRTISSPGIATLAKDLFTLLASPDGASVRAAFIPAFTRSEARLENDEASSTDQKLRDLFASPPTVVIVQGSLNATQVEKAWLGSSITKEGGMCMADCIFVSHSLHAELLRTMDEGDHEEAANVTIMILATLAHELAHWIFVKLHAFQSSSSLPSPTGADLQLRTIHSNTSVGSFASSVFISAGSVDRMDVGDQAIVRLFGCNFEMLSYSIGERQVVKRRVASRRSPSLTPPIIYSLTGQTPRILDVTSHPASFSSRIPPWKSDSMYAVVSSLTPGGPIPLHGRCTMEDATNWNQDRRGSEFSVMSST